MKKILFVLLAVTLVLSVAAIPVLADPPENEWCYLPTELELLKEAGGNQFYSVIDTGTWTGMFTGTSYDVGTTVIHPSGLATWQGWVNFESVEVNGRTGSLEIRAQSIKPSGAVDWVGSWTIINGGGDLAGIQGHGTTVGPGWQGTPHCGSVTYDGNVHFQPN